MLKYIFKKIESHKNKLRVDVIVEEPYVFIGQIDSGNFDQSPHNIQMNIDALKAVQKGEKKEHIIANESGFLAIAGLEDKEQEIQEGVYIYDQFGDDSENPLYIVPIEEIIRLLQDFKKFVEENS